MLFWKYEQREFVHLRFENIDFLTHRQTVGGMMDSLKNTQHE